MLFHCTVLGGELRGHPLETRQVGFFGRDDLPWPLAGSGRWLGPPVPAIDGGAPPPGLRRPRLRGDRRRAPPLRLRPPPHPPLARQPRLRLTDASPSPLPEHVTDRAVI